MATIESEKNLENAYKVKLQNNRSEFITFDVTPDLIETRNVNYGTVEPVHAPGQFNVFKNSSSRSFNISNARLISRTQKEAERNLRKLWLLRSWCTPRFGLSTFSTKNQSFRSMEEQNPGFKVDVFDAYEYGTELLGAPPAVLYLSAYSRNSGVGKTQHINRVPTAIQQLSIPYPSDVDYIPTLSGVPMPTIMTLDMTLVEMHSAGEYERFSLDDFKKGRMRNF